MVAISLLRLLLRRMTCAARRIAFAAAAYGCEMCCVTAVGAPPRGGSSGRRQRCGLDEKRSERPTSCMDHRGSGPRHRRVDFVALVCYRTLGRLCARRQLLLVAQGHIVACCRLEDLRTAAVRELRTDRPRRRLGDTRALQPIKQAARRRRARNEQRDAAAHKTSSERRHDGSRRSDDRNRLNEARR